MCVCVCVSLSLSLSNCISNLPSLCVYLSIYLCACRMKVRGHSIFWNVEKNVPDWVKALRGNMLRAQLYRHLEYMINLARGKWVYISVSVCFVLYFTATQTRLRFLLIKGSIHGCQTWSLNKQMTNKLRTAQRERKMLDLKLQDRLPCSKIRKRTDN